MNERKTLYTRRDFLQTAFVVSAGVALPTFLSRPFLYASPEETPIPGFQDDRILVMVQLSGGNDGLNTVVPYKNDDYYRARSQVLGLKTSELTPLNENIALHQSLEPFKKLYEEGKLAVLNGVGYPNPNRSHFRSMDIWHTASDSEQYLHDGWIGRYLDQGCVSTPQNVCGVNIGPKLPMAFDGKSGRGVSFDNPTQFKWIEGRGGGSDQQSTFRTLNKVGQTQTASSLSNLDYLRTVTANAMVSSDQVVNVGKQKRVTEGYEGNRLGRDLKIVADLIIGRLPTRIYYVSFAGFDTHANQPNQQANLLKELAQSLSNFYNDLKKNNRSREVLTVTFSEFGRRVRENGSRGTDHGTAGPMFILGEQLQPGFNSAYPSLTDLDRGGDLKFNIDFRAVYASILEDWFKTDSSKILGRSFPKIPFLNAR
ncbi:MAG: DUF1501 domain-containing protein [Planctomycetota bacterium]